MKSKIMKIPCKITELCLDLSLNCGQSFRWKKQATGEWLGVVSGYLWILGQNEKYLTYRTVGPDQQPNKLESENLSSNKSIHEDFLKDYFQLDIELESLYDEWSSADPNFCKVSTNFKGVRMLRQDPVENLFAFICSSNNNIQRISGMVEKLCQHFGTLLLTYENIPYYNFPEIEALANAEVEPKLRQLGFGYRAKFIQQSAVKILENGGREWLLGLRKVPYLEAKSALMTLPGIGAKVADCICLMSLNHSEAIPVDTHVFQIAKASYVPHLSGAKSVTDRVYNEISAHFQSLWGPYSGWAHSVLFSADLRHLKRIGDVKEQPSSKRLKKKEKPSMSSLCK